MILVGGRSGVSPTTVAALHDRTGWPIIADPLSAMRHLDGVVAYADATPAHASRSSAATDPT